MVLKLYTDTHIARVVAVQLRAKGVDIVRCEEVGMATAADDEHLAYGAENGRTVVSQDEDFAALHAAWQQAGKTHAGIMLLPRSLQAEAQISYAVRELLTYNELIEAGAATVAADIANKVTYL